MATFHPGHQTLGCSTPTSLLWNCILTQGNDPVGIWKEPESLSFHNNTIHTIEKIPVRLYQEKWEHLFCWEVIVDGKRVKPVVTHERREPFLLMWVALQHAMLFYFRQYISLHTMQNVVIQENMDRAFIRPHWCLGKRIIIITQFLLEYFSHIAPKWLYKQTRTVLLPPS